MRKKLVFALILAVFSFAGFCQNSGKISELLNTEEISKGQASYFVCVSRNFSPENVAEDEAFSVLAGKQFFGGTENPAEKIALSKACFLIARASNMKGGIFYSIFGSERYAFREFKALKIVPENSDPMQKVSGREFLALLNGFEQKGKTK